MAIFLPEKNLDTNLLYMGNSQPSSVYYGDTEIYKIYFGSILVYEKSTPLPYLATPQNVAVDNTTLTFDPVENATSYEVFVDGVSIGTYEGSKTYTLPTALELGSGDRPVSAEGYNIAQGDIELSSSVYNAITALNNGGSLTDFGNTCGLTLASNLKPMFKMGARLELDPSNTDPEITQNGTYLIYLTIPQLVGTMSNIGYIEFDYTNNTATYTLSKNEDIDAENHQLMIEVAKVDGTRLVQVCYEVSTGETWLLKSSGMTAPSSAIDVNINFHNAVSANFTRINIYSEGKGVHISYYNNSSETTVNTGGDGVTGDNATLTFATAPTGDLLTWLQANGTKQ